MKYRYNSAKDYLMVHKWTFWVSGAVVGICAVLFSKIVVLSEQLSHQIMHTSPYLFIACAPVLFFASWALVYFFAPESKGSGIPQVMASIALIEKDRTASISKLISLRIAVVKVLSASLLLIGGGAIGREGPTIQISASLFYYASKKFAFLKNQVSKEVWVMTGAAAGLAAAFNTPLGGIVYAIEELATQHFNKFKTPLIAAVLIAGMASQMISGPYLYLGVPELKDFAVETLPGIIFIAMMVGFLGALFGQSIVTFSQMKNKLIKGRTALGIFAMVCGLIAALITVFLNARFMGSGREILLDLLFTNKTLAWYTPILRFFAPILSYMSGGAGGIFAPSLAAGGTMGQLVANVTNATDSNLFVLLGMIAFLSGVTRAPFTSFILVLEMTNRHSLIFPMMLTSLIATSMAQLVNKDSIYELLKHKYVDEEAEAQKVPV